MSTSQPTAADRQVLATIYRLTAEHDGRPPTLAEITLALGFAESSRGNIQRQLSRLRPTYVTWSSAARSLHLTPEGEALLGVETERDQAEYPIPESILVQLASGLTHLAATREAGIPLLAPYHKDWQRALNRLAAECLQMGIEPPGDTAAALSWCALPLPAWPVRFSGPTRLPDQALLADDRPTELCHQLAFAGDAEMEACEQTMARVRAHAETYGEQDAYVTFRQFLIDCPVVEHQEALFASLRTEFGTLGADLVDLYERVPATTRDEVTGEVLRCGFCGWTLERAHTGSGRLRCGDDRCRVLTDDFRLGPLPLPWDPQLQRVRRAIRRYVVAPGKYEVRAASALRAHGLTVHLWPGYDAYDLHVIFPSGESWAIDIKDWRFPHFLAQQLKPLRRVYRLPWHRAFYAVPDERERDDPGYVRILRAATANSGGDAVFEVVTIGELIRQARLTLGGHHEQ